LNAGPARRIPAEELDRGLDALGLDLPAAARSTLLRYIELLARWNRAYNLTAVRDPVEMVRRHLLDSLAIAPHVRGPRLADIGSGAGLPGIPLAVALPAVECTLLEANGKKARFLRQTAAELNIANIVVAHARAEQYQPETKFDTLVARAFAELPAIIAAAGHLCRRDGRILAMKGRHPRDELTTPPGFTVERVVPYAVPGIDAERHLVIIRREQ
jgi:16S rRNA (guanine527-N7)-methyltransferase